MNPEKAQFLEKEIENMPLTVGFKKLSENAVLPTKNYLTDSGFDLYAAEDIIITPGETVLIATDLAVELPEGYEAQVRPRSGITSKTKIRVQLGTIDNAYRGNIKIIVDNIEVYSSKKVRYVTKVDRNIIPFDAEPLPIGSYVIYKGDKIAQLVIQKLPRFEAVEIFDLDSTDRGNNGFGSSGV